MLFALALVACSLGDVRVESTAQLRAALRAAEPGDVVLLAPGKYEGFSATDVQGAAGRPIRIASADANAPAVFTGGVQFSDVAHFELVDLCVEGAPGNGLNIDDAGSFETPSHHVTLLRVTVRDCGGRANHDGIKLSGVRDFRLEGCTVERWGRGGSAVDMVGCRDGVLSACLVRDDERDPASSGVQAKGGSRDIRIERCRFVHAGQRALNLGGSTGLEFFRPSPQGFEARALTVEGCTFVGSLAPIAFVGVDGASVRFNTFYRPRRWALRILQETRAEDFVPCRNGVFSDNLIVYRSDELASAANVGDATAPETFQFARNWWFCEDAPERARPTLPVPELNPAGGRDPLFANAAVLDLRLAPDSPARAHGADAWSGK
jgi:hypothetical protein